MTLLTTLARKLEAEAVAFGYPPPQSPRMRRRLCILRATRQLASRPKSTLRKQLSGRRVATHRHEMRTR